MVIIYIYSGGDLHNRIKAQKGKPFSENLILDWFTQICLALKHIHDKKILHRDLKSQNVFLNKNNIIKLGDFGISKCLEHTLEKVQTIVGTPYYLSPEIVQNKPYSFKSDIWSLGILLYEMTCLKMPFDATSLPLLYVKIIRGNFNPVPNLFSKELKSLIGSLLIIDPEKRPSINEILRQQIIKSRIKNFLNENQYDDEFSHTILHKFVRFL
jgi:NIMA (never in mitosis gene a)-related kinase 1/4/5